MADGEIVLPGSTKKRRDGRGPDDRRALGELVLRDRTAGIPLHEIARRLNTSEVTARAWMNLALASRIPLTVDEYRRVQNEQLDQREQMLRQGVNACDAILTSDEATQTLKFAALAERRQTITALIRLDERRAKLNGTDAPVRVDATLTVQDNEDAELAAMIAEEKARAASKAES